MGVEVGTARVWKRAEELGLARVLFVNMLDRERADFFRALGAAAGAALGALRRRPPPDRRRARADRDRRRAAHVRLHEPRRASKEPEPGPIPDEMADLVAGVPREAARRGRPDRRGADGALPRGRGARRRGGRARAQGRGHARRGLPGRLRSRDEEPRHARPARPDRRGRAVAGEGGLDHAHRGRRDGRLRLQDDRRPVRRPDQPLPRPPGLGHSPTRRSSTRARTRRSGWARCSSSRARSTSRAQEFGAGRHRRRREAEGGADRRPAARQGGRDRRAGDRLPRAGDELRRHAEDRRATRRRSRRRSAGSPRRIRPCACAATSRPGRRSSRG